MIKLHNKIYKKLQLQADEAKEQGMVKLAEAVDNAIGKESTANKIEYSSNELNDDIHKDLWKVATKLMIFHDIDSVNIETIDKTLISWASRMIDDLEKTLQISNTVKGAVEPKLPGED